MALRLGDASTAEKLVEASCSYPSPPLPRPPIHPSFHLVPNSAWMFTPRRTYIPASCTVGRTVRHPRASDKNECEAQKRDRPQS